MIDRPISVYINWASYDELSDKVELTESLAMRQLDELLRLRREGVRFDYYMMDCFWYAPDGGFRTWRKPHWPDGPDRWLEKCLANDVKPGLWISGNSVGKWCGLEIIDAWKSSSSGQGGLAFCRGGYLDHLMETLDMWYQRGVRMYKFDFTNFSHATPDMVATMLPREIEQANTLAFQSAILAFRKTHRDCLFLAYNGYDTGGVINRTDLSFRKCVDTRWLETFDALYCGDPRPADVPAMNFWRSKDIYSDHMVRLWEFSGVPLPRIDNSGFMIGTTGTCYFRRTEAWKPMLILSLARGGWANTYYGNLDLLDAAKARWFAKVQGLFMPLQGGGIVKTFGGIPGKAEPYGFSATTGDDALITVVNPSQAVATLKLPIGGTFRLLFTDSGFTPALRNGEVTLGPEQMALIGFGRFAAAEYDLGLETDVKIPSSIETCPINFEPDGDQALKATFTPSRTVGKLRLVFRQFEPNGTVKRTTGGSPPGGKTLGTMLTIQVTQDGKPLEVKINYDKAIWSGLSWAAGEVTLNGISASALEIRFATTESKMLLKGEAYWVAG